MGYSVLSQDVTLFEDRIFTEQMFYDRPYFNMTNVPIRKRNLGTSLVAQKLRICLPIKGTQVQFLVRELRFPHSVEQLSLHATVKTQWSQKKKKMRERERQGERERKIMLIDLRTYCRENKGFLIFFFLYCSYIASVLCWAFTYWSDLEKCSSKCSLKGKIIAIE